MSVPPESSLLLAMDTSGDVCSVAVLRDGRFMAEHAFRHEMHLSERLMGNLDVVLRAADATLEEVDLFAVGIGPGSFTGTRIGVMTLKTFAVVRNRPIFGVNGLEAMAAEYCGLPEVVVTPILPCRAGVVYACPFSVAQDAPVALAEPAAFPFAELGALLQTFDARTLLFCGPAALRYALELRQALEGRGDACAFGEAAYPRASVVGKLAWQRLQAGESPGEALALVPLYISPPPITLPKQPIPI